MSTAQWSVDVTVNYIPEQSGPALERYVFAYTIQIANQGTQPGQLLSRHWIITDGAQRVEEVRGPGVVGQQPWLQPGQSFEYTSGCVLETPVGTMRGTYHCVGENGVPFEVDIAEFVLAAPHGLH